MSRPVGCHKSVLTSNTKPYHILHTHTHACDLTLSHHILHTEGVKDTPLTLHVRISPREYAEAISSTNAVAANVLNPACLPWQPSRSSVHILAAWDLHLSVCVPDWLHVGTHVFYLLASVLSFLFVRWLLVCVLRRPSWMFIWLFPDCQYVRKRECDKQYTLFPPKCVCKCRFFYE